MFIPLLFMTGVVGRLFSEFAVVLAVSVVVSAVVSLTLTPMMCGRHPEADQPARLEGRIGAGASRRRGFQMGAAPAIAAALDMVVAPWQGVRAAGGAGDAGGDDRCCT